MISAQARLAGIFVLMMSLLALSASVSTPDDIRDIDQVVYEDTLHRMQDGQGYYEATRASLIEKDGLPPTQVRSYRTPIVLGLLRYIPEQSWRYVAGLFFAATIGLCAALAHPFGRHAASVAAVLVGFWTIGYAPLLYLHAEIWALPLALGALLLVRRAAPRVSPAALALLTTATLIRELFGLLLLLVVVQGLVSRKGLITKRLFSWPELWPRLAAVAALLGGMALHAAAAAPYLAEVGYEPPFGNEGMKPAYLASAIGPGTPPLGLLIGLLGIAFGTIGFIRLRHTDPVARAVGIHSLVLLVLTLTIGRVYWSYVSGPLFAAFVPAGFSGLAGLAGLAGWNRGRTQLTAETSDQSVMVVTT